MNKKLLKIITVSLFLISSFGGIQYFLGMGDVRFLNGMGNGAGAPPPPPPPPPPPLPGKGLGKSTGVLNMAMLNKISNQEDIGKDKDKVVEELKNERKAKSFFAFLSHIHDIDNIRSFLVKNGFDDNTPARKVFEEKAERLSDGAPTADEYTPKKKPQGKVIGDPGVAAKTRVLGFLKQCLDDLSFIESCDLDRIQQILDLDQIKNLATQKYPVVIENVSYTEDSISKVKESLEKRKDALDKDAQEKATKAKRRGQIDSAISESVKKLQNLYHPDLKDFQEAFTFPENVSDKEKEEIVQQSWDGHIKGKNLIYYIIQFKIYDLPEVFKSQFKFLKVISESKLNSSLILNINNLMERSENLDNLDAKKLEAFIFAWNSLPSTLKKSDFPEKFLNLLKEKLRVLNVGLITAGNKENVKKIFNVLGISSELSEDLKSKLGIKTPKKVAFKTSEQQVSEWQIKYKDKRFEDLTAIERGPLAVIKPGTDLFKLLNPKGNSMEEIFNAIKIYQPSTEVTTGDGDGKKPPVKDPSKTPQPPMPARPLSHHLKQLKINLIRLKESFEGLDQRLITLKDKLS